MSGFRGIQIIWLAMLGVVLAVAHPSEKQRKPGLPANNGLVCWQEGVKLRWKDFEASRYPMEASLLDVRVGACSATEVAVLPYTDAKGKSNFLVESFFIKKYSWVRDSSSAFNRITLDHEQVHFDINELFARKVRRVVAQYYLAGRYVFGPELNQEISHLLEEKTAYNKAFDNDAYRDPSGWVVAKWQALVNQQLATLGAYASTSATCSQ